MIRIRAFILVGLFLGSLLPFAGCKNEVQEAWQSGYDASYKAARNKAWQEGNTRGLEEGKEKGTAAAREGAQTGYAWQLYSTLAWGALLVGTLVGICVQYVILFVCSVNPSYDAAWNGAAIFLRKVA